MIALDRLKEAGALAVALTDSMFEYLVIVEGETVRLSGRARYFKAEKFRRDVVVAWNWIEHGNNNPLIHHLEIMARDIKHNVFGGEGAELG